jgi:tetratricopeptide (TPR) repeat protein
MMRRVRTMKDRDPEKERESGPGGREPGEPSRLEQLEVMRSESPGDRDLRYFLAHEYLQRQRYAEALAELEEYFRSGEDEGMGFKMRATCLFHLGRSEEARACLREGIDAALRHHHRDLAADIEESLAHLFPEA